MEGRDGGIEGSDEGMEVGMKGTDAGQGWSAGMRPSMTVEGPASSGVRTGPNNGRQGWPRVSLIMDTSMEAWHSGSMEAWRSGSMEAQYSGSRAECTASIVPENTSVCKTSI